MKKSQHFSYHPCQPGVPAVLQDKEAAAGGLRLAAGLQTRTRQCCQVFQSAPLARLQGAPLWFTSWRTRLVPIKGIKQPYKKKKKVLYLQPGPHSDQKLR